MEEKKVENGGGKNDKTIPVAGGTSNKTDQKTLCVLLSIQQGNGRDKEVPGRTGGKEIATCWNEHLLSCLQGSRQEKRGRGIFRREVDRSTNVEATRSTRASWHLKTKRAGGTNAKEKKGQLEGLLHGFLSVSRLERKHQTRKVSPEEWGGSVGRRKGDSEEIIVI